MPLILPCTLDPATVTLWRPTGPEELALVKASAWSAWPPRLPEQPISYPVLNETYATRIVRERNAPHSGVGHVTRFRVRTSHLDLFDVHQVGGTGILSYWSPAEELDQFNANLVGLIELVGTYTGPDGFPTQTSVTQRP